MQVRTKMHCIQKILDLWLWNCWSKLNASVPIVTNFNWHEVQGPISICHSQPVKKIVSPNEHWEVVRTEVQIISYTGTAGVEWRANREVQMEMHTSMFFGFVIDRI